MSLLGPSSWEEIAHRQTDRQTTGIHPPSHSPPRNTHNLFFSIFYIQLPRCARELDYPSVLMKLPRALSMSQGQERHPLLDVDVFGGLLKLLESELPVGVVVRLVEHTIRY